MNKKEKKTNPQGRGLCGYCTEHTVSLIDGMDANLNKNYSKY
jgi:hypothetical protein